MDESPYAESNQIIAAIHGAQDLTATNHQPWDDQ